MLHRFSRHWLFAGAALATLVLAGCPLETPYSLDEPRASAFDARLLGEWTHTNEKDQKVTRLTITKLRDAEYQVVAREPGEDDEQFRAFVTTVRGVPMLNVREVKSDTAASRYSYARYTLSADGTLTLRFVSEYAMPKPSAASRAALVAFISAHLNDGALTDSSETPFVLHRANGASRRR